MPDPKNNVKASGDIHPPEVEDDAGGPDRPGAQGADEAPPDSSPGRDVDTESRPGKGINQAGFLKDKDTPGGGQDKP